MGEKIPINPPVTLQAAADEFRKQPRPWTQIPQTPADFGMFYITASSAFYVDASRSDNMELLKGPRRSAEAHVPRPPAAAAAAAPLGWQMAPAHIITSLRAFYSDTGGKCDSRGSRNPCSAREGFRKLNFDSSGH